MRPCICLFRFQSARPKRTPYLIIQVDAVGHQNDLGIHNFGVQGQGFREHHHGQRFATSLGMPDHASRPGLFTGRLQGTPQDVMNCEILLVPSDLLDPVIEKDKLKCQFKKPFRTAQAIKQPILLIDFAALLQNLLVGITNLFKGAGQ